MKKDEIWASLEPPRSKKKRESKHLGEWKTPPLLVKRVFNVGESKLIFDRFPNILEMNFFFFFFSPRNEGAFYI